MLRRVVDRLRGLRRPAGQAPREPQDRLDPRTAAAPPRGATAYDGPARIVYAPERDGDPDPGEVVWAWIPYEEDPTVGKDRPAVVVGRAGEDLVVVPLSSRPHGGDEDWFHLGSGTWDARGRPSSVRLDRAYVVAPDGVRREGATLDRARFDALAARLMGRHPWTAG